MFRRRAGTAPAPGLAGMGMHGKNGNGTGSAEAPRPETHSCFCQAFALGLPRCHSLFLLSERCQMDVEYSRDTRSGYAMLGKVFCFSK